MEDEQRDRYIGRMCCTSVVAIVISAGCIVVGCLSIAESAPKYLFPYCLGGSAIAGVFVMMLAACNIKLYCNYLSNGRTHEDEDTVKRWALRQILLISLTAISLVLGLGVSGIWGMVKATDVINFEAKFNLTSTADVPYARANLVYAVCSFVFVLVLSIVQIVLWCTCLCYTDTYGFTDSNTYYNRRYHERHRTHNTSISFYLERSQRANEYRPPTSSVADPGNSDINRLNHSEDLRVNIPRVSDAQRPDPSAPSMSRESQGYRPSATENSNTGARETSDMSQDGTNASGTIQQPPQYEQLFQEEEDPPPSYSKVMTEGPFKVTYI